MDIKIKLDKSEYAKQRLSFMKSLQIPTLSEAKSNLGSCLAQILFDQCDTALKVDFGLTPLKGAGDDLWVSPSDLLIGKVALTPPLTSKHIQALTHEGILKIGGEIEKKFQYETLMLEENYFEARKRHMVDQFEEMFRVEAKNIELRERQYYQHQNQMMIEEFSEILIEELNRLEEQLKEEQKKSLKNQKILLDLEWEQKFKQAVDECVREMTIKFIDELDRQKFILMNNFKLELQKAHMQRGFDINLEKTRCKESFNQLKHNLECKNIANMMYILCMERRKCCEEKQIIEQHYMEEIKKLKTVIFNRDNQIKTLKKEKDDQVTEVNLREACLLEIIRQFQKFINFALRAAPTQAEFLLSIEKMMAFELTNTVLKSNYSHLKPCNEILPWKSEEKPLEAPKDVGLEIKDHHNCFKELTPNRQEEIPGVPAHLPAFTYKNRLYVREDFRNMVSQGIVLTKSDELWSKDVEILIQTLRKSVSYIQEQPEKKSISSESSEVSAAVTTTKSIGVSSVQFLLRDNYISEKQNKPSVEARLNRESTRKLSEERRASLKPVYNSLQNINFEQIGKVEKKPALIAATNSVELIIKKGSVRHMKTPEEEEAEEEPEEVENYEKRGSLQISEEKEMSFSIIKNRCSADDSLYNKEMRDSRRSSRRASSTKDSLVLDTKDSVIMKKTSLVKKSTEFTAMPKDSLEVHMESKIDLKRKPSKLVTAKNSLELLRESKLRIDTVNGICPTKESQKQKPIISCTKSRCNEKCQQGKDNLEIEEARDEDKYTKKNSAERSIKLSRIEVFKVDNSSREINVSINSIPTVYDTGSATFSTDLTHMYKEEPKVKKNKKKKVTSAKDKFLDSPNTVKVVGDVEAKEHLQTTDTFTEERIHSLIDLIKDNPTLLRTFTACRR